MKDVTPTTATMDAMATALEDAAREIRKQSQLMQGDGDLTRAAEAAAVIANLMPRLRLDLLIIRPLRALGVK